MDIFQQYGIKEVADLSFYKIDQNGDPGELVLYIDTAKVSTIEQTAEQTEARGGKGNPPLVIWDYGKELTLNIEDALFSPRSMEMMFARGIGAGVAGTGSEIKRSMYLFNAGTTEAVFSLTSFKAKDINAPEGESTVAKAIANSMSEMKVADTDVTVSRVYANDGTLVYKAESTYATTDETVDSEKKIKPGERVMVDYVLTAHNNYTIVVDAAHFPGTYYVVGDTYARSAVTGEDEFFQFIIPKAKMGAENTLTLEAEGDPTTFNMTLRVMRSTKGEMIKLIKYDFAETASGASTLSLKNESTSGTKSSLS
nr:MAG TPA: structural protein [Caudoviricetes sp.]